MPYTSSSRPLEFAKIALPAVLAVLLLAGTVFGIFLPQYRQSLMDSKKDMIRELVHSSWSMLAHVEEEVRKGQYSLAEGQQLAKDHLRQMRYNFTGPSGIDKDYFWINDLTPVMIMHPYRPDLEGQDLTDYADPDGAFLFREFVATVTREEEGFVHYKWQWKDDASRVVPKLSFVKLFAPWGWIIGTGIYLEDVQEDIARLTNRLLATFLIILTLVMVLTALLVIRAMRSADERRQAVEALREHEQHLEDTVRQRTDELRQSNETLNREARERKNAERAAREQLHFLQDLVDAIPNPVYFKNAHGLFTGCNAAFETLTGRSRQAILGLAAIAGQTFPWDEKDRSLLANAAAETYEATVADTANKPHHFVISTAPYRTTTGVLDGLVVVLQDITDRKAEEEEKARLITELQTTLADIKTLSGLLPICAHCKKIRDDSGYWKKIESYIQAHSKAEFSHSICPECADKFYPEYDIYDKDGNVNS